MADLRFRPRARLVLDGHDIVGFERDALHREVHRQQGNGLQQAQSYDPVGRLLEQHVSKVGGTAPPTGAAHQPQLPLRPRRPVDRHHGQPPRATRIPL